MISKKIVLGLVAATALGAAGAANAGTGCNGIVNQFIWGCAFWDNNNGPQYPFYKKKVVNVPASANVAAGTLLKVSGSNLIDARTGRIVAAGAGNIIAQGGGNIIAQGGGNIIAQGGGNVVVSLPPN